MDLIKLLFFICVSYFLTLTLAYAEEDWRVVSGPVTESGPGTPVVGDRWSLSADREGVKFLTILDSSLDMTRGNWYGHIRASEKFYAKVYYIDQSGRKVHLKLEDAGAIGPDAEYGIWKKGPATTNLQVLQFDLTRDKLMTLKRAKTLIVNYASFETPQNTHDILFPMEIFKSRLDELDSSIAAKGGQAHLMTKSEIENTPIKDLPLAIRSPVQKGMGKVAEELSVTRAELMALSITQVKAKIEDKKKTDREDARTAKRAAHQTVYDQEPDWMDLNICPKPDVSFCKNVGLEAYDNDILVGGDFSYGKIKGVVWRSKGSIVRIYGGSVDLGIEPEIYRAKTAKYYYIVKNAEGQIDIRGAKGMLIR